jgi:hypothetical protein
MLRQVITTLLGRPVPPQFVEQYHYRSAAALKVELKAVADIETVLATIDMPYCVAAAAISGQDVQPH